MAIRKIKLTIAYDGSGYHGWQRQPNNLTIEEVVSEAISGLVGQAVKVQGASRTDAGVSAIGQAASIEIDSPIPTENLAKAITDRLPEDIAVSEAQEVPGDFDVVSDVKSKLYRYTIYTGKLRPVFEIRNVWHLPVKLDIDSMNETAKYLVGRYDFKSFASAADTRESTVREIYRCEVMREGERIYFDVEGDGFLYNMVRNIVGTLVEAGVGRMEPIKMKEILEVKDRTAAGPIAPAAGLCLISIEY
ncbi:MAG: tRNA pseudouridine(38-40) synthase TruA [Planctomycetota bacterium]|jgi:tRNA pseudouridine38-40 synthase